MQLAVLQEDLLRALITASRFIATRNPLPILGNVLLKAEKGRLRIAATNLETGVSLQIGAKIEKEGSITVPAKIIVELVSNLPAGQIKLVEDKEHLQISTQSFQGKMGGIIASEFPKIPEDVGNKTLTLSSDLVRSLADKVVFSASNDESRPILTGVLLNFEEEELTAVSTDGFRLSRHVVSIKGKGKHKLLVPAKLLDEVAKLFSGEEEIGVSVLEKEKQLIFGNNTTVLTGRLLEGAFPDYERILPKKHEYRAVLGKQGLLQAVRAASVFARESASIVRFRLRDGEVEVLAESGQHGSENVRVEARTSGEEAEIAFNYKFVLEFLASIEGEEVSFETESPTSPGAFRDTKDPGYLHVIMPVRVQT